jgi:hypothetical protein
MVEAAVVVVAAAAVVVVGSWSTAKQKQKVGMMIKITGNEKPELDHTSGTTNYCLQSIDSDELRLMRVMDYLCTTPSLY